MPRENVNSLYFYLSRKLIKLNFNVSSNYFYLNRTLLNRDILKCSWMCIYKVACNQKYKNKTKFVVVVDQFTPGYQFRPTPNFLEDL